MIKEKASTKLFLCLFFIYTMNTFGKIAFPAVTAALINESILTKTQAGFISGAFWFVYALGQFAGGSLVSKFSASFFIKLGIISSAAANFLLAVSSNYETFLIVWCLNGVLQMGFWPGVLHMLSNNILREQQNKAFNYIAYCYGIGSILSHLCTAAVLSTLTWRYLFIVCGIMGLVSLIPLIYAEKKLLPFLEVAKTEKTKKEKTPLPKGFVWKSGIVLFCMLFFIKSVLDSGIKTWMPTLLMETHGASPSYTSILSVALLLLNLFGVSFAVFVYKKLKENEATSIFTIYMLIVPFMASLLYFRSMNTILATVVFTIITVFIYSSGQIFSTYYPSCFQKVGGVAFIGGIMNCFAAMGNVVATAGNGAIADLFGWDMIIYFWNALIAVFVIICLVLMPIWKKFLKDNNIK